MHRAGELRKESTPPERKLWAYLRGDKMGVNFRRHTCPGGRCQGHAVGKYIVDFCSPKAKLVIELDGSHYPRRPQAAIGCSVTRVTEHLDQEEYDEKRTEYLASRGYKVIRFWNKDVMNNIEGVILAITHILEEG